MLSGAFRGAFAPALPRLLRCCGATIEVENVNCLVVGVATFATDFIGNLLAAFFRAMPDNNRVSITCQTRVALASATKPSHIFVRPRKWCGKTIAVRSAKWPCAMANHPARLWLKSLQ